MSVKTIKDEATTFLRNAGSQLTRVAASSEKNGSLTLKVLMTRINLGVEGSYIAKLQHVRASDTVRNSTGGKRQYKLCSKFSSCAEKQNMVLILAEDIPLCYIVICTIYVATVKHNYLLCL